MNFFLVLFVLLSLFSLNTCFKLNNRIVNSYSNSKNINTKRLVNTELKDQAAFVTPLAISIFTMVPFLFYQQALRPKERTVKQIELDEQLRPKDKKLSSGKAGSAKAQGKKK